MSKRCLSLLLSVILLLSVVSPAGAAFAASYVDTLKAAGFPEDYAVKLEALHQQYPKWNFVPLNTGLSFSGAVAGERTKHKNQIIETSYDSAYFCSCGECKKNGKYVKPYAGCYCASEWAVSYFMDPRNWLDEQHIFMFEDNRYNAAHNTAGVEKIIANTWMNNADITYINTNGVSVTYTTSSGKTMKYAKAILKAAKEGNISAYCLASRIVKEVGTKNPANVSGVAGNKAPFIGIYNFYSIGATSGGMSGLEWAAGWLMAKNDTKLYPSYDPATDTGTGTPVKVKKNQYMCFMGGAGSYFAVRLYSASGSSYSTDGAVGYIPVSDLRTTYFNYERPWTDPYKAIVGGAKYIAAGYLDYQYTGYLEKFNVNKSSGRLYAHEYMQNVDAPAKEAVSRYKAYASAGQLSEAKTFYIPVFTHMDAAQTQETPAETEDSSRVTDLHLLSVNPTSLRIQWNAVSGATEYKIKIRNLTRNTTFDKTVTVNKAKLKNLTVGNEYRIVVSAHVGGTWTENSGSLTARCLPKQVTLSAVTSKKAKTLSAAWKKAGGASGYQILVSPDKSFKKDVRKVFVDAKTLSHAFKKLKSGKTYYVKVRAYTKSGKKKYYGKFSKKKKITVK